MRSLISFIFLLITACSYVAAQSKKLNPNKEAIIKSVDKHQGELTKLSDEIWRYAETALRENKSAKTLADYAEAQGFRVKRGVAHMPTAFTAEYGSGKPSPEYLKKLSPPKRLLSQVPAAMAAATICLGLVVWVQRLQLKNL